MSSCPVKCSDDKIEIGIDDDDIYLYTLLLSMVILLDSDALNK